MCYVYDIYVVWILGSFLAPCKLLIINQNNAASQFFSYKYETWFQRQEEFMVVLTRNYMGMKLNP